MTEQELREIGRQAVYTAEKAHDMFEALERGYAAIRQIKSVTAEDPNDTGSIHSVRGLYAAARTVEVALTGPPAAHNRPLSDATPADVNGECEPTEQPGCET